MQFCSQALVLEAGSVFTSGTPQTVARRYHQLLFEDIAEAGGANEAGANAALMN